MPTPITEITKEFTYKIADSIYAATDLNNRTAAAVYTGPDRIWVFVNNETGDFSRISPPLTSLEDGDAVPVPIGHIRVEIVAEDNPMIISLIKEDCVTYSDTSLTTENLPEPYGSVSFNTFPSLSQTYNVDELSYNIEEDSWRPLNYITSHTTWQNIISSRNVMLTASDGRISPDMPDAVKQPWITYRQALRDLPAVYGYGTDNEIASWKVKFPEQPED